MMKNKLISALSKATLVASVAGMSFASYAAGFSLTEQSVTGLGRSFAGGAAWANDATTLYFNPAGITRLKKPEMVGGASLISLTADFDKTSGTDAIGQPLTGGEGGPVGKLGGPATLYYTSPINDEWYWGFGFNAPFGLATDYDRDWVGRYQATYSRVAIINLQPTIARKVSDSFSWGFGIDVQYMEVKLENALDFGAICFGQVGPVTCTGLGLVPQGADGYVSLEGNSVSYGWNGGLLWEQDGTRLGVTYRGKIKHSLDGDADFSGTPAVFAGLGVFTDTGIEAEFTTPELISLSVVRELNPQWTLSFDLTRTGWDTFQELRVQFDNPNQPDSVQPENWVDVYKASVGADWRMNDRWTLRAGFGYDNSPVSDADRTARLPDGDRTWLSGGATWHYSEKMEFTVGYAYLQLGGGDPLAFDQTGATQDHLVGTYEGDAHIVGFEMRMIF
jgi:long-chain fatty acid transport protein